MADEIETKEPTDEQLQAIEEGAEGAPDDFKEE